MMKKARVIKQHTSEFPQPLILKKGDIITCKQEKNGWIYSPEFNGADGWIPKSILELQDQNQYIALRDYTSFEMNVEINDTVKILEETSGWAWIENEKEEKGWVPLENLEIL